ncbi:MAG TPA: malto-oligosyltrehalose trehalohydrolase [Gemmatimonadaceae bacterium]|nr:malto-oligosyltrehalose trehalohydrolase [Gemmatimonadaceae bacterium]
MGNTNATITADLAAWRQQPIGVEIAPEQTVHARVWAPTRSSLSFVELGASGKVIAASELDAEGNGYFSGVVQAGAGTLYKFRLDGGGDFPDPASRFQPFGPHGPSQVVDARRYAWRDGGWRGPTLAGAVIYEMHVGTFTTEGTYRAAIDHLGDLADVGISVIEMMPVAEFPGRFGWGYDGVSLFAPSHLYGAPDDLRAFIDAAHAHGIGVILDVVYNHLGPDGNFLKEFSKHYFKGNTEWGEALNFDGEQSASVREFFIANAAYWPREFHFDGLRLDATQQIFDSSEPHILFEIVASVRAEAQGRSTIVVAENEPQDATLIRRRAVGGYELDALWNDDFHHIGVVSLTGDDEAYYSGYRGAAQEFVSSAKYGFLYQGEWYRWQRGRRGTPAFDVPPIQFINFIQNHDQIANSAFGARLHRLSSPSAYRAVTALLLLLPQTPMLFQGQEFLASSPFLYFADHNPDLASLVRRGRVAFLGQFAHIATPEVSARLDDPGSEETFARCKLNWEERREADRVVAVALVRDLIRLRRKDATLRRQGVHDPENLDGGLLARAVDGAAIGENAFVLRYFGESRELDRVVAVNLGRRVQPEPLAEPLIAPPSGMLWRPMWSSEDPAYGGCGTPSVDSDDGGWVLPAESTILLAAVPREGAPPAPHHPTTEQEARAQWKARYETTAR